MVGTGVESPAAFEASEIIRSRLIWNAVPNILKLWNMILYHFKVRPFIGPSTF